MSRALASIPSRNRAAALVALASISAAIAACSGSSDGGVSGPGVDPSADGGDPNASADGGSVDAPSGPATGCDLAKPFGAPEALASLNTAASETAPRISRDGLTIYFSVVTANGTQAATYVAKRPSVDAAWGSATLVGTTGLPGRPTSAALTDDELTMFEQLYFGGDAGTHLYSATRTAKGGTFQPAQELAELNGGANDVTPFVLGAGLVVYFSSDRQGSAGQDLLRASRASASAAFGAPVKLAGVNGPGAEAYPVASADELTLFFSSKRSGSSGYDIFVSTRASASDAFGAPVSVAELNSAGDEHPGSLSSDGCELYLASTRTGGLGASDLYVARRGR